MHALAQNSAPGCDRTGSFNYSSLLKKHQHRRGPLLHFKNVQIEVASPTNKRKEIHIWKPIQMPANEIRYHNTRRPVACTVELNSASAGLCNCGTKRFSLAEIFRSFLHDYGPDRVPDHASANHPAHRDAHRMVRYRRLVHTTEQRSCKARVASGINLI